MTLRRFTAAGGSIDEMNAAKLAVDPETGESILANIDDEKRRKALIRVYYMVGNELCMGWPPGHPEYERGELLRKTAARLQAFPTTLFIRSRDAWGWGLLGFTVGADID